MMHHQDQNVEQSLPGRLYQRYATTILAYLDRRVSIKEDAEDLLLEVFLAALENQKWIHLKEEERLAWLRQVARNKLVDHYRRISRHPKMQRLEELTEIALDEELNPEQQALFREEDVRLRQEIAALPKLQQDVLLLRFGHGLRTREIASMLQRTDSAIRIMLSRTLNRLRNAYDQQRGN